MCIIRNAGIEVEYALHNVWNIQSGSSSFLICSISLQHSGWHYFSVHKVRKNQCTHTTLYKMEGKNMCSSTALYYYT